MQLIDICVYKKVSYLLDDVKGICVISRENILAGDVIEVCATLAISPEQTHLTDQTPLYHIVYTATDGKTDLVVFGNGSLYNHSPQANMAYHAFTEQDRHFVRFTAKRAIEAGDELTIDYYDDTANEPNFNLPYDPRK